jgi:hypothetical protein
MSSAEQEALWRAAQALARDAAATEVFRRIEARCIASWREATTLDDREAAHARIRALDDFRAELAALAAEPSVVSFNRRLRGTQ